MPITYEGRCHCTAIGFHYESAAAPADWSIRACQCSFCQAHGALSASDPDAIIEFFAREPQHLQRYRFALRTADFLLCTKCGVYIGAIIESASGRFGIVNTRVLVPMRGDLAPEQAVVYDGETAALRVARREERWSKACLSPEIT